MAEQLRIAGTDAYLRRTCGPATSAKNAVLLGWVHRVRDLGSLLFLDVRDRHGLTQVIVEGDEALLERAKRIRSEFVVAVLGRGRAPFAGDDQPGAADRRSRGPRARKCGSSTRRKTPPFSIAEDQNVSEETRLKYRYLDLRRPQLQHNIGLRHRITMALRKYFDEQGFYEIETPILTQVDARRRARLPGAERACIPASSTRCRSRRRSSSRS